MNGLKIHLKQMILTAIIKFEKTLDITILKTIKFPEYVLEKWCSGCKVEFISDNDYDKKKVFIHNLLKEIECKEY